MKKINVLLVSSLLLSTYSLSAKADINNDSIDNGGTARRYSVGAMKYAPDQMQSERFDKQSNVKGMTPAIDNEQLAQEMLINNVLKSFNTSYDADEAKTAATTQIGSEQMSANKISGDSDFLKSSSMKAKPAKTMDQQIQEQLIIGAVQAVKEYDWSDPVNMFKSAHASYKQDVKDAQDQGQNLLWYNKGLLGAKHYGSAYLSVTFGFAGEIAKVAGPQIALLLLTALIAV